LVPERRFTLLIGALALVLASVPYFVGWLLTPAGFVYTGLTTNIDDSYVYLAWMRHVASGAFFQHNQFCAEPEARQTLLFNLWFLVLGTLSRALPPILVFHLARILGGAALLWAVARLLALAVSDERARKLAFALVCFSAGLGWLIPGNPSLKPFAFAKATIDTFQHEAITFQSLYYSPLFAPATFAMVVFITALLRSEQTGKLRDTLPACLAGFLLGNSHTYDVIPLFAVALAGRLASDISQRKVSTAGWIRLVVIGAAALPSTAHIAYVLKTDAIFRARANETEPTYTSLLPWVLLGYGFLLPLGILGALQKNTPGRSVLICWVVVGVAVAYLPFEFQRKLLMGPHIPIALLAGIGLSTLAGKLSGDFPKILALFGVLITVPSNALLLLRDITRLQNNESGTAYRPYLTQDEASALAWLRENAPADSIVLVAPDPTSHTRFPNNPLMPHLAAAVPAHTRCIGYNGHWSETKAYGRKLGEARRFFSQSTDDSQREALLITNKIRYILYLNHLAGADLGGYIPVDWTLGKQPGALQPVYTGAEITIFEVSADD
uniref:hypothetical protein n=1 Tax=Armatimonas sp. TaxID=1872638 RepID=UPI003751ED41